MCDFCIQGISLGAILMGVGIGVLTLLVLASLLANIFGLKSFLSKWTLAIVEKQPKPRKAESKDTNKISPLVWLLTLAVLFSLIAMVAALVM